MNKNSMVLILSFALSYVEAAFSSQSDMVLIADPRVLAIAIVDNNEQLIDLRDQDVIAFGSSPEIPDNTDYTKMRTIVYEKLCSAQTLLPQGYKLCVYECYRSLSLQQMLFDKKYDQLRIVYPDMPHNELFIETTKFVSPVINLDGSKNVPPHSTGSAVDVYLVDEQGQLVDMGINVADSIWLDEDGSQCRTDSDKISPEAKRHRKIMGEALTAVGFINYPFEYWHWSYGDRYWAFHKHEAHAPYGSVS